MFLFLLGMAVELGVGRLNLFWRYRIIIGMFVSGLVAIGLGLIPFYDQLLLWAIMFLLCLFRLFNLLRTTRESINEKYLRPAVSRTSLFLIVFQLIVLEAHRLDLFDLTVSSSTVLLALTTFQLITSITILGVTSKNLFKTRYHSTKHFYSDKELPTVTVAIPARNETADLSSCLQSILSNNYPKLEVLVLDDCSQDRTSEIIKDFAQDGVRFLEGSEPPERWLAKNHAYDQLASEASGELILFCGVDVRMGPDAIRALVTTLLNKKRYMLSVMPLRIGGGVRTAFIQPMRYWWELALPRRFFNRPPVLSTCWLIRRKTLHKLGGFKAVSRNIIPEGYFARELVKTDHYAFIRADEQLDIRTVKSISAQLSTAIRTRYPQLRRRPENVLVLITMQFTLLLLPFIIWMSALFTGFGLYAWLALLASFLLVFNHYMIMSASNPSNTPIALVNFPFIIVTEIVMLYLSMYRYEFFKVEWKGRNICIPLMRTLPRLPKI